MINKAVTISAIILTKNESRNIVGCIASIINSVDEVLVYDTGSTDNTLLKAKKYDQNINVVIGEWHDSFADARNNSIEHANCNWIIFIDADERLIECSDDHLKEVITDNLLGDKPSLGSPKIISENRTTTSNVRIIPNNGEHKFIGRVHEYVDPTNQRVIKTSLKVSHSGYNKEYRIGITSKRKRNIDLLNLQISEDPNNFRWKYYYALYTREDCVQEGIRLSKEIIDSKSSPTLYNQAAYSLLISSLLNSNNIESAIIEAKRCIQVHSTHYDSHCILLLNEYEKFTNNRERNNIVSYLRDNEPCDTSFLNKDICKEIMISIEESNL